MGPVRALLRDGVHHRWAGLRVAGPPPQPPGCRRQHPLGRAVGRLLHGRKLGDAGRSLLFRTCEGSLRHETNNAGLPALRGRGVPRDCPLRCEQRGGPRRVRFPHRAGIGIAALSPARGWAVQSGRNDTGVAFWCIPDQRPRLSCPDKHHGQSGAFVRWICLAGGSAGNRIGPDAADGTVLCAGRRLACRESTKWGGRRGRRK